MIRRVKPYRHIYHELGRSSHRAIKTAAVSVLGAARASRLPRQILAAAGHLFVS